MCAACGAGLHLVGKLGFSLDDRYLKRAGLDYWQDVCMGVHRDFPSFLRDVGHGRPMFLLSKKARRLYTSPEYGGDEVLVFGPESDGLPESLLAEHEDRTLRIPIRDGVRSLNLAAAVHVVVFHILAQRGFADL